MATGGRHFRSSGDVDARAPRAGQAQPQRVVHPPHVAPAVQRRVPATRQAAPTQSAYTSTRKRKRNVLPVVLIVVGVALLLTAAGLFIHAQLGYREAASAYDNLANQVLTDSENSDDGIPEVDFDALAAEAPDVVGWIYIPGTNVSYPVVQGDSNEEYLRTLPNGTANQSGSIFMDYENTAPGVVDQQTTLYGHHMNDGSMFKAIDNTLNQDEFDKIEKVYYITRNATYVFEPMFTAQVEDDYTDARVPNFESEKAFTQYLQATLALAKANAEDAGAQVQEAKQVLTLVTCAGEIIPRTTRAAMVCTLVETIPAA